MFKNIMCGVQKKIKEWEIHIIAKISLLKYMKNFYDKKRKKLRSQ